MGGDLPGRLPRRERPAGSRAGTYSQRRDRYCSHCRRTQSRHPCPAGRRRRCLGRYRQRGPASFGAVVACLGRRARHCRNPGSVANRDECRCQRRCAPGTGHQPGCHHHRGDGRGRARMPRARSRGVTPPGPAGIRAMRTCLTSTWSRPPALCGRGTASRRGLAAPSCTMANGRQLDPRQRSRRLHG